MRDSAKRLKRTADVREEEHVSYGGTSEQWMNDIKAVRGILPILEQVLIIPDDSEVVFSSSDQRTTIDNSGDSDSSGDDADHADDGLPGSKSSDGPGGDSAHRSKSTYSKATAPTSPTPARGAGDVLTKKRGRSQSTDDGKSGKRRKKLPTRPQVRETIVKNTYITRTRDLNDDEV